MNMNFEDVKRRITLGELIKYIEEKKPHEFLVRKQEDSYNAPIRVVMSFSDIYISMAPNMITLSNNLGYIQIDNIVSIYLYNNCLGDSLDIEYAVNRLENNTNNIYIIINKSA